MEPSDVHKTAVTTPFGLFNFTRTPFGLRNSGQTFQRFIDHVTRGLDFVFVRFCMKFKLLKSFDNQLIWCDVSTGHNRPYLTTKFRRKVFSNLHGLGHPSHRATKPLINTRFVWHGMNIDIARWCRTCKGCQTAKVSQHSSFRKVH